VRQRFFAVDVLAGARRRGRDQPMPVVRHGQHHGVDIVARQHVFEVVIRLAVLVLIFLVDRRAPCSRCSLSISQTATTCAPGSARKL